MAEITKTESTDSQLTPSMAADSTTALTSKNNGRKLYVDLKDATAYSSAIASAFSLQQHTIANALKPHQAVILELSKQLQAAVQPAIDIQNALQSNPGLQAAIQAGTAFTAALQHSPALRAAIASASAIQETLKPLAALHAQIPNFIAPYLEAQTRLQEALRPVGTLILDRLQEYEDFRLSLDERHQQDRVVVPPFFYDLPIVTLQRIFRDKSKPAIQIYSEFFSVEENLDAVLDEWSHHDVFARRIPILRDAFSAHLRREYTLSIPVFLSQIEGILDELLLTNGHKDVKVRLQEIFPPNKPSKKESSPEHVSVTVVVEVICEQIFKPSDKLLDLQYPNRHQILHGSNVDYYEKEFASDRLILILDLLRMKAFDLSSHDEDKAEEIIN